MIMQLSTSNSHRKSPDWPREFINQIRALSPQLIVDGVGRRYLESSSFSSDIPDLEGQNASEEISMEGLAK
jgi:hypothetical protein